jgi:hypothetical protein
MYSRDDSARYWRALALDLAISLNKVDYRDEEIAKAAAPSLSYRPLSLNHGEVLAYPENRVDFTAYEDGVGVWATIRISNNRKDIQAAIDEGRIKNVSLEARKEPDSEAYHFTGLSLLERGKALPGLPRALCEVQPLTFNESVEGQICQIIDGKIKCGCDDGLEQSVYDLQESVALLRKQVEELTANNAQRAYVNEQVTRRAKQILNLTRARKTRPKQQYREV